MREHWHDKMNTMKPEPEESGFKYFWFCECPPGGDPKSVKGFCDKCLTFRKQTAKGADR